jgi:hypothetical protein
VKKIKSKEREEFFEKEKRFELLVVFWAFNNNKFNNLFYSAIFIKNIIIIIIIK